MFLPWNSQVREFEGSGLGLESAAVQGFRSIRSGFRFGALGSDVRAHWVLLRLDFRGWVRRGLELINSRGLGLWV